MEKDQELELDLIIRLKYYNMLNKDRFYKKLKEV